MQLTPYYESHCQKYPSGMNGRDSKISSLDPPIHTPPSIRTLSGLDPLGMLLSGKLRIVETSIDQIAEEISGRERLRDRMLETIDKEICLQKELLYQVAPHGSSPFTVGDPKRRVGIERAIATLDAEKRQERCSAWKDIAGLNKELRVLLREQEEEKRRQRVIGE